MRSPIFLFVALVCAFGATQPARADANGLTAGQAAGLPSDAFTALAQAPWESRISSLPMPRGVFLPPQVLAQMDQAAADAKQQQTAPPVPEATAQGQVTPPRPVGTKPTQAELKPAGFAKMLQYSLQLIFYEHVMRIATQPFTRAELEGPFWLDYHRSVKMPQQWDDGDSWEVNYIGHPMHGSAGVRLWLAQREPLHMERKGKEYWKAMGRAGLFGLLFSEQFEIGPMSEASIGNVGMYPGRTGWVDHVITPLGSIGWTMYEDAMDKYVLTWVE
jgi:hypothetical protein